jgi:ketosteroid isomerase-like protein
MKYIPALVVIAVCAAPSMSARRSTGPEQDAVKQELIKVENDWKQAVVKRDATTLRRLYADDYMSTDSEGMVWNKAEDVEIDTTGVSQITAYNLDDLKVRLYGDVAVVTGRGTSKGTLHGRAASAQTRFTDVFVKRDARWQCVATQTTPITKQ